MTKPTKKSLETKPSVSVLSNDALHVGASTYFRHFVRLVDPTYQLNWHHRIMCDKLDEMLQRIEKGESPRVMFLMPPRHGKTETVTIKFPTYVLGRHPDWPIIVAAYSADLAVDFGRKSRDQMETVQYQSIFETRLREDVQSVGRWMTAFPERETNKMVNTKDGGYMATGLGGSVTGRGFKLGIIDDPFKNREEAESQVFRDKVWSGYLSTFYTRQEGNAGIAVVLTRWHEDDLAGRLLKQQREDEQAGNRFYDKWEVVRMPALAEEDDMYRDQGDPLWPAKFPLEMLLKTKNTLGPYDWSALYQQRPINAETQEFRKEYFRIMVDEQIANRNNLSIRIMVDPAISTKKEACNTAIVAVAKVSSEPDWYIPDYIVGKFDPGQLIDNVFVMVSRMAKAFPRATLEVNVEAIAYQQALVYLIEQEQRKRKIYFVCKALKTTGDKTLRIRGLIPLGRAGTLWIKAWMSELQEEAASFPKGQTVDILDAISFNLLTEIPDEKVITHVPITPTEPDNEYAG